MFSCSRVFEDNSHYNEVFGPYGNAFVGAIEWLFTDVMSDGKPNEYYNLSEEFTPDFMSCVWAFIGFAKQPQAKLTLKDELNLLKPFEKDNVVGYEEKTNKNVYYGVTPMYIQAVLLSAHIYCTFISEKDPENKEIINAARCLYEVLVNELTDYIDQSFSGLLFDQIEPTLERFRELAPTDEEIAEQQKAKDIDEKTLDDYLADPIYKQCYDGIFEVLGTIGLNKGKEYTEEDYLNVYKETEKLVNEVLESKHPEIAIRNIQTRLRATYHEKKENDITYTTPEYLYGRVIERVFCIVAFDKLEKKDSCIISAFEYLRGSYVRLSINYTYTDEKLWKMMVQRIPYGKPCPPPAPAPEPIEDKNQHDELQAKYDELLKQYEEAKEELEAYKQEPITDNPHNKVRLKVFCNLLENSGVDFKKRNVKAECGKLANYITGITPNTCQTYMTYRDLSYSEHEKEILDVNSILRKIGINWHL